MAVDPRFQRYIENDPIYQQAMANAAAGDASALAQAQAQARRLYILFGGDYGAPSDWIDDNTRQLGAQNTKAGLSTLAQLDRTHQRNLLSLQDALAARGMLRSGELGHGLEEENYAFQKAGYDQRNELAQLLAGIQSGYAGAVQQGQGSRSSALSDAYGRAVDQYAGTVGAEPGSIVGPVRTGLATSHPAAAYVPPPGARPAKPRRSPLYGLNPNKYKGRSF